MHAMQLDISQVLILETEKDLLDKYTANFKLK